MTAEAIGSEEFEHLYRDVAPELFAYVRRRSTAAGRASSSSRR